MKNKIFSITAIAAAIVLAGIACGGGAAVKTETLTLADGSKYEGQVNKDRAPHGKGTMTYPGRDGKYPGRGTPIAYVGEWKDGKQDGQGTMTYSWKGEDYSKYEGEWKDGKYHGQGTYTNYSEYSGHKYEGEWKDGKEHGHGTYTEYGGYGDKYEGEWKDGKHHGQGTMTYGDFRRYAKGCKYVGEWKDDSYGQGTMTWPDGAKYEGEWVHTGTASVPLQGTLTLPNGKKYSGRWGYVESTFYYIELYDSKGKVILEVDLGDWEKGKFPKK